MSTITKIQQLALIETGAWKNLSSTKQVTIAAGSDTIQAMFEAMLFESEYFFVRRAVLWNDNTDISLIKNFIDTVNYDHLHKFDRSYYLLDIAREVYKRKLRMEYHER